jgi:IS1 family transposase
VVAYVWGKRDLKTAKRLKEKLLKLGISFGCVCRDDWQRFITAFKEDNHVICQSHTVGIEGTILVLDTVSEGLLGKLAASLKSCSIT